MALTSIAYSTLIGKKFIQVFNPAELLQKKVKIYLQEVFKLACEARKIFKSRHSKDQPIWLAASVGSYGTYLADGSEYSGAYNMSVTVETLNEFHRRRFHLLAKAFVEILEPKDISILAVTHNAITSIFCMQNKENLEERQKKLLLNSSKLALQYHMTMLMKKNILKLEFVLGFQYLIGARNCRHRWLFSPS